ncbi:MAG TPA: hypothetical protein PKH07_05690, partial [bacterium]|nr:hypothetical protein [bacterium]
MPESANPLQTSPAKNISGTSEDVNRKRKNRVKIARLQKRKVLLSRHISMQEVRCARSVAHRTHETPTKQGVRLVTRSRLPVIVSFSGFHATGVL